MRIAIDINDVIRDYSDNFMKVYIERYNHEYDLTDFEMWSNDMSAVFPFKTDESYYNFVYDIYAYDIFAKCETCTRNLPAELSKWMGSIKRDIDEDIEVILFSPKEYGSSIGYTYFFISKLNIPVREVYFPMDSLTIFDKCDVLITANPDLLVFDTDVKKIAITTDYNKEIECEYRYKTLAEFISDENNILKLD